MALHPSFPKSPYAPLIPGDRWFPAAEDLRDRFLSDTFLVRTTNGVIWIVETKGMQELDLPQKMTRLKQWCADATAAAENGQRYDFVFVDQLGFEKHGPKTIAALAASFIEYKT